MNKKISLLVLLSISPIFAMDNQISPELKIEQFKAAHANLSVSEKIKDLWLEAFNEFGRPQVTFKLHNEEAHKVLYNEREVLWCSSNRDEYQDTFVAYYGVAHFSHKAEAILHALSDDQAVANLDNDSRAILNIVKQSSKHLNQRDEIARLVTYSKLSEQGRYRALLAYLIVINANALLNANPNPALLEEVSLSNNYLPHKNIQVSVVHDQEDRIIKVSLIDLSRPDVKKLSTVAIQYPPITNQQTH